MKAFPSTDSFRGFDTGIPDPKFESNLEMLMQILYFPTEIDRALDLITRANAKELGLLHKITSSLNLVQPIMTKRMEALRKLLNIIEDRVAGKTEPMAAIEFVAEETSSGVSAASAL